MPFNLFSVPALLLSLQCSSKMLTNMLEGPTQGEILPLSLHEFKKEELLSLGKNSSFLGKTNEIQTLVESDVESCQISILLWASLITTSWHSVSCGHIFSLLPPISFQVREGDRRCLSNSGSVPACVEKWSLSC